MMDNIYFSIFMRNIYIFRLFQPRKGDEMKKTMTLSMIFIFIFLIHFTILDAVHVEGNNVNSIYSYVFDLNKGITYLYYWHQFDEVDILNIEEELTAKTSTVLLPTLINDLFSEETLQNAVEECESYKEKAELTPVSGKFVIQQIIEGALFIAIIILIINSVIFIYIKKRNS
jgi:hypothetical protein